MTSRPRRVTNPSSAPLANTSKGAASTAVASDAGSLCVSATMAATGSNTAGATSEGARFIVPPG